MQRRTKILLLVPCSLAAAAALAFWLIWFPPWTLPLEKWLIGSWDGSGQTTGQFSIEVASDPGHGVPGGKAAGTITSTSTIWAEFKPDGTYTWHQEERGEGNSQGISASFWVPEKGGGPVHWEIISVKGNRLAIQLLMGEVVFVFENEDTFTMTWPEAAKGSGTIIFHRSVKRTE
jgi:hypothetical protein